MTCKNCGNQILDNTTICPACGVNQAITPPPAKKKKKKWWIAVIIVVIIAILAIAFGGNSDTPTNNNTANPSVSDTDTKNNLETTNNAVFHVGDTWVVNDQWELTVTSVEETSDRNQFSEKEPAAVYIVNYTYKNIGYVDRSGIMDGLYFSLDESIIDSTGKMGYSYPGDITNYPQETPVDAYCEAQACIGVDNAGSIKLNVVKYDGNGKKQTATFDIEIN